MGFQLRDYQQDAVNAGIRSLSKGRNDIIVAPTASGKSLIISSICSNYRDDDVGALILQPTKEILEQNYAKLLSYGVNPSEIGIYSASMKRKDIGKFTYATVKSVYKNPDKFSHFKRVIMDEVHAYDPANKTGMYHQLFEGMGNPCVIGLTATPYRIVKKFNRKTFTTTSELQVINRIHPFFFKSFCFEISMEELLRRGYIVQVDYEYPEPIDLSKVPLNNSGTDYHDDALEVHLIRDEHVQTVAETILEYHRKGLKNNLVFCHNNTQSVLVESYLKKRGINVGVVMDKTSPEDRDQLIQDFREGKLEIMINCNVFNVGFDYPGLYAITMARPTTSASVYMQQVGRVLRLDPDNPDKRGKVIDIVRNSLKFGRVETIKLAKETGKNHYKDILVSEVGQLTGFPIDRFRVERKSHQKLHI